MKVAEAALFAVLLLGVVVLGAAIVVSAVNRNPKRDAELKAAREARDRLAGLVSGIYGYVSPIRGTDPVADYIAGEIEGHAGGVVGGEAGRAPRS